MGAPNYWLDLFTGTTWQEFLDAGANVSGFRENRWTTVQKIKPGDFLLCYLIGVSRFIGILEVVSEPYKDDSPIWKDEIFPCRMRVKVVVALRPETAVPVRELEAQLSMFRNLKSRYSWIGHFRGSPTRWKQADAKAVVDALREAKDNPTIRPVDPKKLAQRPRALKAKIGSVTVPGRDESDVTEPTAHEEIQWLLLKLGSDMGLDVWVARNDRGKVVSSKRISDLPSLLSELPVKFDEPTTKTIEMIDVLWVKGNAIVGAFEVESTTSIYSGLLRMADLVSMQPNINIPLFLVAPDERRSKVITEVNRPTFSKLVPPLAEVCRFVSFSTLRDRLKEVGSVVQYLKPEFLEDLSESCEVEEE